MKIPYLTSKRLANGEVAYYFNIPARLIPEGCTIKSQPLGKDYFRACQKALELLEKLTKHRQTGETPPNPKTVRHLWKEYQTTRFYKEIGERMKAQYERSYKFMEERKNAKHISLIDTPLDLFDYRAADKLLETFLTITSIFDVKKHFAFLRRMYKFGIIEKIFPADIANPFSNMRIKTPKPKRENIPHEHLQMLIQKAKEMGYSYVALAIELDYYLCQRPADILKLRKKDIYKKGDNYFICFVQNKTGEEMRLPIPLHLIPQLMDQDDYIIADDYGAFTVERFSRYFKKVSDACGFHYVFKLMRHTGGTAYIETGATTAEAIMFTGHKEERIFNEVYKSPTEKIGLNALNKRLEKEGKSQNEKK